MSVGRLSQVVRELGRTEGGPQTLSFLTARQHTRRLLLLRALVDAVRSVPARRPVDGAVARARQHWSLLEAADLADPDAARQVLFYPLVGPWAERCVRRLAAARSRSLSPALDLEYLGALAVAAAARSGLPFTASLTARAGRVVLPTLGALRCASFQATTVVIAGGSDRLTFGTAHQSPVELRRVPDGGWHTADPRWRPIPSLPGGPRPVLLDDVDPTRTLDGDLERHGMHATGSLSPSAHGHWLVSWQQALSLLRLGGHARWDELTLLRCLVPLSHGEHRTASEQGVVSHSSGTRKEAFGAVFASAPPTPALLAACLVHEFQHAKLAALTELTPLHTAGTERGYWAPWRPDPRPFDGLLHGAYAHLALADHWRRLAQAPTALVHREQAWAEYSRCWEQVGAVLPVLLGSSRLTWLGRVFVTEMSALHARMARHPPPEGHRVRAAAAVETARIRWRGQHAG